MEKILNLIQESIPPLLHAFVTVTIPLSLIAFILGLCLATVTALVRISKVKALSVIAYIYVWFFRGTPLIVQLFIIFFGLPSIGVDLNAWIASLVAFSLNTGAYASESIRGALLAFPRGQYEAAVSLGLSKVDIFVEIVAPQVFRVAMPSLSNNFISLVKDTSLAATITVVEVFMTGQRIAARTYEPLLLYCLVAAYYLVFCSLLNIIQAQMEKRLNRY